MELEPGQIVISTQGRDKGSPFIVIEIKETNHGTYVYLADGKKRKVHQPKRKNIKHLQATQLKNGEIGKRLQAGLGVTNSEIRKIIAGLMDGYQEEDKTHEGGR